MTATVKVQLAYSTATKPAGSPQTASISVSIKDAGGNVVATSSIDAPSGVPAASEVDITCPAGTGMTAEAVSLDASGQATGAVSASPAFDVQDDVQVTVVASIAKV
jgi:hypothetical protein